jgi:phage regulator Rha-like protein
MPDLTVSKSGDQLDLKIIQSKSVLLVDSRIVANRLGIEHESFTNTIKTYRDFIEQQFGILRFEIGEIVGRGQPEKYFLLDEDQSFFLMTLSRNTEQVIKAKADLVKAFSAAKKRIAAIAPVSEKIRLAELRIELAKLRHEQKLELRSLPTRRSNPIAPKVPNEKITDPKAATMDSVQLFVDKCLTVTDQEADEVSGQDLHDAFKLFCDQNNLMSTGYIKFINSLVAVLPKCRVNKTCKRTGGQVDRIPAKWIKLRLDAGGCAIASLTQLVLI